jgi:uncharacterized protein YhfF/predicted acetyltransferase
MNAEALWAEFCQKKQIAIDTPYEAWAFGSDAETADELAELVVRGVKFGTASAYDDYVAEDALDELPRPGDYSVILNSAEEAVCVIRTYDVYIRPFREVPPFHAYAEGEGDRSLAYWRRVHKAFFEECAAESGIPFTEESLVVCEKFSVEYVPGREEPEEKLLFAEPSMAFAEEIAAYRQELLEAGSGFDGCFSLKRMPDMREYTDYCIGWSNPSREADEHGVWGTVLLCIRAADGKMVGCMQVHNVLNERMRRYTGHVGYSVRPSERRKGYAKRMLARAKDFLSAFGFREIFVSCLPSNEASRRTILANGGEYVETVFLESDGVDLERYRIGLQASPAGAAGN